MPTTNLLYNKRLMVPADVDKNIHWDSRALLSLLTCEMNFKLPLNYFKRWQEEINEQIRAETAAWLFDVCNEEVCDPVVFPLAISFMDRVIRTKFILRKNLQALASACLFLATKVKAPSPISAEKIVYFTDGGIKIEELLEWEMIILNHLDWKLFQPTAFEFYDIMKTRTPVLEHFRKDFISSIQKIQFKQSLATLLPSWQAGACLLYLATRTKNLQLIRDTKHTIRHLIQIEPDDLLDISRRINCCITLQTFVK